MDPVMNVFDRRLVRRHRDRAAGHFAQHDFLVREVAERLAERLNDVTRAFPRALDLGCHSGVLAAALGDRGAIETLIQSDLSGAMARLAAANGRPSLVADEELLPFAPGSFDLVMSVLSLHWVNDLPGTLIQIGRCLKPDGLFLAALLGGETLGQLRAALLQAELEVEGGASPRVSPFLDLRDAGALLQRAGFALPVADRDVITVDYPDALALMADLRAMGEANALEDRRRTPSRRTTLLRAAALYQELYARNDGRLPATFDVIYLTAWAPHASQPKPLRPGSAAHRLAEALDTRELPTGDKIKPK
jgi:SAM-dependent methyltransferase